MNLHGWLFAHASTSLNRRSYYRTTQSQTTEKRLHDSTYLGCVWSTVGTNCQKALASLVNSFKGLMTGTTSINVTRINLVQSTGGTAYKESNMLMMMMCYCLSCYQKYNLEIKDLSSYPPFRFLENNRMSCHRCLTYYHFQSNNSS